MLDLVAGSRLVMTDSGGLQEEASWLGVPTVVLRRSTPRWEGVANRTAVLAGLDVGIALGAARRMCCDAEQSRVATVACPYGDGTTAAKVVETLSDPTTAGLLHLAEPDFVGKPPPA
jgi:UDP-N-acetylglucosamine 2-epimerase (non-hydrolysing)